MVVGVMAVFGAFNATVSHYELVQSIPRAFYEIGLVVIVALAFVPSTIGAIDAVREADRARTGGRVVRRGRLVRMLIPILESGMERAVGLAESMDARGFARGGPSPHDRLAGWLGLGSLLALGGGFVALVSGTETVAAVLGVAGVIALVAAATLASRGTRRARYRPRRVDRRRLGADRGVRARSDLRSRCSTSPGTNHCAGRRRRRCAGRPSTCSPRSRSRCCSSRFGVARPQ